MVVISIRPDDPNARVKKIVCDTLEKFLGVVVPSGAEYWIDHKKVSRMAAEDFLRTRSKKGS